MLADSSISSGSLDGQVIAQVRNPTADGGVLAQVQDDSSIIERMDPVLAHPFKAGFAESMDTVFLIGSGVGLLAFLVLLLMPQVELRATSAGAAARAEEAEEAEEQAAGQSDSQSDSLSGRDGPSGPAAPGTA